ncbi:unnamed protein product [Cylindrotheca closterium]|uniref:Uncharacterized protein n=1 Tax=Cylindrotheca closterium TaxID=2856 RepID=A0AAD2CQF3_9STRA|nr:unnamed protein product [Cylindrotheca closterium]
MDQYYMNTTLKEDESMIPLQPERDHRTRRDNFSSSSNLDAGAMASNSLSELLGISEELEEEMIQFVKSQRIREWARQFRRSDPRYQILNFFNDVAQEGAKNMDQMGANTHLVSPLLRAFYKSSVFTVWRPTSYDAIRRMMLGEGVGKGLDIKGKSAKKGRLSGFVPFLQIHQEEHKKQIRTLPKDGKIRVFYNSKPNREKVVAFLQGVRVEMVDTVKKAKEIVEDDSIEDDETNEWALSKLIWDMTDSTINLIDDYAPKVFGIEVAERLFWEGLVVRQDIRRETGSVDDTGRPSEPNFQNMNFGALRPHGDADKPTPQAVILLYNDPLDDNQDPLDPRDFLMAYEEPSRVMPVVSDFDCFIVGTRGVKYDAPLPSDQLEVSKWCISQIESILESEKTSSSWTSRWLDVLKTAASKGFHPTIPPLGFSDPKSHSIMKHAIHRLQKEGAVRHGAECFNYYFPQELDEEFLVISDRLAGQSLPWKYVDQTGLQEILKEKIDQGYTFPINPKWILCDPGWKDVFDQLRASNASYVQDSIKVWYPPGSGLLDKIEDINKRFPDGFQRKTGGTDDSKEEETEGTAAMDLAELELKYFLTLQRAKRKLRGFLIWRRLLDDRRKRVRDPEKLRESLRAAETANN